MVNFRFAPNIIVAPGTDEASMRETNRSIDFAAYERDTLAALDAIWEGSWTGTSIIQGIADKPGVKVIITPHLVRVCNAQSDPLPKWTTNRDINVQFLPSTWQAGSACATAPSAAPAPVLLHELVHAYRQINGKVISAGAKVPGFNYENKEEFYAILLTNIHLSATGQRVLRRDHTDHKPLYPELSSSEPFLVHIREHRLMIQDFFRDHHQICQNHVRMDQCPFNPIDYFLTHSAQMVELMRRKPDPPSAADLAARRLQEEALNRKILQGPLKQPARH
jgi:hypothetical protein